MVVQIRPSVVSVAVDMRFTSRTDRSGWFLAMGAFFRVHDEGMSSAMTVGTENRNKMRRIFERWRRGMNKGACLCDLYYYRSNH